LSETSSRLSLVSLPALVVCGLLLLGAYLAGRWLIADLGGVNASTHQANWRELDVMTSKADWQDAHDSLQRAIELKPDDAFLYEQLAIVFEFKFVKSGNLLFTEQQKEEARYSAVDAFRKSAQLRPAWPDGWAHLARTKAYISEIDDEFSQAFNNAISLGATEPRVDNELRPLCPVIAYFEVPDTIINFCSAETE
jgi:hypothetical protein